MSHVRHTFCDASRGWMMVITPLLYSEPHSALAVNSLSSYAVPFQNAEPPPQTARAQRGSTPSRENGCDNGHSTRAKRKADDSGAEQAPRRSEFRGQGDVNIAALHEAAVGQRIVQEMLDAADASTKDNAGLEPLPPPQVSETFIIGSLAILSIETSLDVQEPLLRLADWPGVNCSVCSCSRQNASPGVRSGSKVTSAWLCRSSQNFCSRM